MESLGILKLWDARGLLFLALEPKQPRELTRVFAAYKNEVSDRQIGDRRGANGLEGRVVGPSTTLPPGQLLTALTVPRGYRLIGSSTDRADSNHQSMISSARAESNAIGPCFKIGDLEGTATLAAARAAASPSPHDVEEADCLRRIRAARLCTADIPPSLLFDPATPVYGAFRSLYQGDHIGVEFSTEAHAALLQGADLLAPSGAAESTRRVLRAKAEYERAGVKGSDNKDVLGSDCITAAGAQIDSSALALDCGGVFVSAPTGKLLALAIISLKTSALPAVSEELASNLAGSWIAALMFRRKVAQELVLLATLVPVMSSNVSAGFHHTLFCSDASTKKGAFCCLEQCEEVVAAVWLSADRKGHYTRLDSASPPADDDSSDELDPGYSAEYDVTGRDFAEWAIHLIWTGRARLLSELWASSRSQFELGFLAQSTGSRHCPFRYCPVPDPPPESQAKGGAWAMASPGDGTKGGECCRPVMILDSSCARGALAKGRGGIYPAYVFGPTRLNVSDDPTRCVQLRPPAPHSALDGLSEESVVQLCSLSGSSKAKALADYPFRACPPSPLLLSLTALFPASELLDLLPQAGKRRFGLNGDEKFWTTGLYSQGPFRGVRKASFKFPLSTQLACCVVQRAAPGHVFTSVALLQNVRSAPHKDRNNAIGVPSFVCALSRFSGGQIWVEGGCEDALENIEGSERYGELLDPQAGPVYLDGHRTHLTREWVGTRKVAVAFCVKDADKVPAQDWETVRKLGFRLPRRRKRPPPAYSSDLGVDFDATLGYPGEGPFSLFMILLAVLLCGFSSSALLGPRNAADRARAERRSPLGLPAGRAVLPRKPFDAEEVAEALVRYGRDLYGRQVQAAWDLSFAWLAEEPYNHHTAIPPPVLIADRRTEDSRAVSKHQAAKVEAEDLVQVIILAFSPLHPLEMLWPMSPQTLRKRFDVLLKRVGASPPPVSVRALDLGSFRPGGATYMLQQTEDSELCRRRGRWASARVMEIYLQEIAASTFLPLLPKAQKDRIFAFAAGFITILEQAKQWQKAGIKQNVWYKLWPGG
ncbi:unnamed protein product [Symbiodinium necroappetens]|uniref:Uncharacterized protein n=1 Tax=Symbiodinium necroappetens TaxID=1628268 RepID=A0A812ITH9_9DINO|nr:unnamed protein product [Symbiodinium necroappetens]